MAEDQPFRVEMIAKAHGDGCDVTREGISFLLSEIERLKDVLHRDQTGLAKALAEVVKTTEGYSWVAQGRGPYEWDDDEYRKEMGRMLAAVEGIARKALQASGNLAHRECCGRRACLAPLGCDCPKCIERFGPIAPGNVGKDLRSNPAGEIPNPRGP